MFITQKLISNRLVNSFNISKEKGLKFNKHSRNSSVTSLIPKANQ